MADEKRVEHRYGPWRGLNEYPGECGPDELEDLWNADCRGDVIETRNGRVNLFTLNTVFPIRFYAYPDDTGGVGPGAVTPPIDGTAAVTDGDTTTVMTIPGLSTIGAIWIGFAHPVTSITFTFGAVNVVAATTMTVKYWSPTGLTAVSSLVDGTSVGGISFGQNGTITFTAPTDWIPMAPPHGGSGAPAYFLQLRFDKILTNPITIKEVRGTIIPSLLGTPNGSFHWKRRTGERLELIGMDDTTNGIARLYSVDRFLRILRSFIIPGDVAVSGPDAQWVFVVSGDSIVCANGYNFLYSDPTDPYTLTSFVPVTLQSAASRSTVAPSQVTRLAIFQDQLAVVERGSPNTVQLSDPVGAVFDFVGNADLPLGGMHTFDPTKNFDCLDPNGAGVSAMASQGQHLLIMTPGSTHTWDGFAHRITDPGIGCIAPLSLKTISSNGSTAAFFLGYHGIYKNEGGTNVLLSRRVYPSLSQINWLAASRSVAAIHRDKKQYRLWVPAGPNGQNNRGYVYDYDRNTWSKYGTPPYESYNTSENVVQPYLIASLFAVQDEEFGDELLAVDYSNQIWLEDIGEGDLASGYSSAPSSIQTVILFDRMKWEDQGTFNPRYLRFQMKTYGAPQVPGDNTGPVFVGVSTDGTTLQNTYRRVYDGTAPTNFGGLYELSLLDPDVPSGGPAVAARQVFASQGAAPGGIRLGVDPAPKVRFIATRSSFGLVKRNVQPWIYVDGTRTAYLGVRAVRISVRGYDFDETPGSRR